MKLRALLFFALVLLAGVAHAGDEPIYTPAPDWVLAPYAIDATRQSDADPLVLVFDAQQRLQDGTLWAYSDTAMRIASTQMLVQAGTLALPWDPDKGDILIHGVKILRGTSVIDVLEGGARFSVIRREQKLESASLDGMLTATLTVEGLQVGDILRLTASFTRKDAALDGRTQTIQPLPALPIRVKDGRVRLIWPSSSNVRWASYAKTSVVERDIAGGYHEVQLPMPVPALTEIPSDAPPRFQPVPVLQATSFADWGEVARVMGRLYDTKSAIAEGSPLAREVARIAAASSDPRTRAALALQSVQDQVRYLYNGMEGGNYVPQTPERTWEVRYGDCKAKSLLLVAMLRALGIEADAALASLSEGDRVPDWLPMPAAFDHVIVRAKIGDETFWLDGTGRGARAEELADTPPVRHALPLIADAALVDVPLRAPARPETRVVLDLDQSAGLGIPTLFRATVTTNGEAAEALNLMFNQSDADKKADLVRSMLASYLPDPVILGPELRYDAATNTAVLTATGINSTLWTREEGRYRLALDPFIDTLEFEPDRSDLAVRDVPVDLGAPSHTVTDIRVRLPDGGKGFTLDGETAPEGRIVGTTITRKASIDGDRIEVEDVIRSDGGEIASADIPAARARVALAKRHALRSIAPADYPAHWQQVLRARESDAFKPWEEAYARAIAADPDEPGQYINRASFRRGIFDWKGALADYTAAIEHTNAPAMFAQRGWLYHVLGQPEKALADMREAHRLQPGDNGLLTALAQQLSRMGRHDEALALLEPRIAAGGKDRPDLQVAKADIQGAAGRIEAALATIDQANTARPGNPSLLNSRCWLKGTRNVALDTGLKDCTRSIELSENPSAALDSRAMIYFRMGRMEEAREDLDAALALQPSQAASLFLRGIVRLRMGDKEGGARDLAAARMMAPQVETEYAGYGVKP